MQPRPIAETVGPVGRACGCSRRCSFVRCSELTDYNAVSTPPLAGRPRLAVTRPRADAAHPLDRDPHPDARRRIVHRRKAHSGPRYTRASSWSSSAAPPSSIVARPWTTTYSRRPGGWIPVPSKETATRGSRRTFSSFRWRGFRCAVTSSSPSTATHTQVTCGAPFGLIVTRWPSAPVRIAPSRSREGSRQPSLLRPCPRRARPLHAEGSVPAGRVALLRIVLPGRRTADSQDARIQARGGRLHRLSRSRSRGHPDESRTPAARRPASTGAMGMAPSTTRTAVRCRASLTCTEAVAIAERSLLRGPQATGRRGRSAASGPPAGCNHRSTRATCAWRPPAWAQRTRASANSP